MSTVKAAFVEALARSRVLLDPDACAAAVAAVTVKPRTHRDDGFSSDWAAGMPKQEAPVPVRRRTTDAEALRWRTHIDNRIADALAEHRKLWLEVHGRVIAEERKRWRAEVTKLELRVDALAHAEGKRQAIAEAAERRADNGDVVELPRFLSKRASDAA